MALANAILHLNGKHFLVPEWREVSATAKLSDFPSSKTVVLPRKKMKIRRFRVKGRPYVISLLGTTLSCNCPGNTYHGKCKHIRKVSAWLKAKTKGAQ